MFVVYQQTLRIVHFPEVLAAISNNGFGGCTSLDSIIIPGRVTSIGENAFAGCKSLKYAFIPASVKEIGPAVFASFRGKMEIDAANSSFAIDNETFLVNKTNPLSKTVIQCLKDIESVCTAPQSYTRFESRAFSGVTKTRTVVFPASSITAMSALISSIYTFRSTNDFLTDGETYNFKFELAPFLFPLEQLNISRADIKGMDFTIISLP